jgi:hypothetical protein
MLAGGAHDAFLAPRVCNLRGHREYPETRPESRIITRTILPSRAGYSLMLAAMRLRIYN